MAKGKPFIERTDDARLLDPLNMSDEDYEIFFGEEGANADDLHQAKTALRECDGIFAHLEGADLEAAGFCQFCRTMVVRVCACHDDRLQQLREEFEAARRAFWHGMSGATTGGCQQGQGDCQCDGLGEPTIDGFDAWLADWRGERALRPFVDTAFPDEVSRMETASRRYIMARDFNEFDPKRALMLWKLRNGDAL